MDDLLSIALTLTHIDRLERATLAPSVQWRKTSSDISREDSKRPELKGRSPEPSTETSHETSSG